jgi:hypothetical protein
MHVSEAKFFTLTLYDPDPNPETITLTVILTGTLKHRSCVGRLTLKLVGIAVV